MNNFSTQLYEALLELQWELNRDLDGAVHHIADRMDTESLRKLTFMVEEVQKTVSEYSAPRWK